MRSRKLFFVLGLTVLTAMAVALIGCSDDDDNNPIVYPPADDDPEFMVVQGQLNDYVDTTLAFFKLGFAALDHVSPDDDLVEDIKYGPGEPDDIIDVQYNSITGWHIITITRERDRYACWLRDSIQFRNALGVALETSTDCVAITFKRQWGYQPSDQNATHCDYTGVCWYEFSDVNTNEATIDGNHNYAVQAKYVSVDSTIERSVAVNGELTDFTIEKTAQGWSQWCPTGGSCEVGIGMIYTKDAEDPVVTSWTAAMSFDNGAMTVEVQRGNDIWDYDVQLCTPPPVF